MYDNRSSCVNATACSCATRFCARRVLTVLAVALALVVGAILGTMFVSTIIEAMIPLIIFAIGLVLAIVLILIFFGCRCNRYIDNDN